MTDARVSIVSMTTIIFADDSLLGRWLQPQVLTSACKLANPREFLEVVQTRLRGHTNVSSNFVTRDLLHTALGISLGGWEVVSACFRINPAHYGRVMYPRFPSSIGLDGGGNLLFDRL